MRSTLFIDFDGVLRDWPIEYATLEAACDLPVGAIMEVAFECTRLERVVTGKISDATWRRETAEELSRRFPDASARAAIHAWSESAGAVNLEVLGLIEEVRPNCQVVLITNGTDRLLDDLARLGLCETFDAVVNSSEVGFAKPNAEIFQHALAVACAEPQRVLFVDDSWAHVEGASRLGICGHHYQGPAGLGAFLAHHGLLRKCGLNIPLN